MGHCQLDDNNQCRGCFRLMSEITGWLNTSETEKKQIVSLCHARKE
ncbi:DUF1289 domain-containing protein [Shewanella youngdeokensis]|uniref:DUF1289 domain-containing protein n=1 Tax=Shewanella youngdeokensis TaxID=2999068 RepID=A0ABZ0K445_9GAMM|nr:DUF1289 domain-containing protein [Shewanella sp. DAU334]